MTRQSKVRAYGLGLLVAACGWALVACCRNASDGTHTWPGPITAAAAEREATCAIERGAIRCWGTGYIASRVSPPPGSFQALGIASGCGVGLRFTSGWQAPLAPDLS